jgi:hypothetical protein
MLMYNELVIIDVIWARSVKVLNISLQFKFLQFLIHLYSGRSFELRFC